MNEKTNRSLIWMNIWTRKRLGLMHRQHTLQTILVSNNVCTRNRTLRNKSELYISDHFYYMYNDVVA